MSNDHEGGPRLVVQEQFLLLDAGTGPPIRFPDLLTRTSARASREAGRTPAHPPPAQLETPTPLCLTSSELRRP